MGAKRPSKELGRMEKILAWAVSGLGATLLRLMGATWRVHWVNDEIVPQMRKKYGGVIFPFWHNQMLIPAYTHRNQGVRILISPSKDGEYIARTVDRLGFVPVRGSSSREGSAGLNQLVAEGRSGHDVSITPDGPRGPRYEAKIGLALLARGSGLPVIPSGISAHKRKELNTWDRFCIPHLFTRVAMIYGEPVFIPADASIEEVKEASREIERRMQAFQKQAEHFFDKM